MRAIQLGVSICAGALLVTGCGDWSRDPLAGRDKMFHAGTDKPGKEEGKDPMESSSLQIIGPRSLSYAETQKQDVRIEGRALLDGYDVAIDFENIDEFPGMKYDETKKTLSWSPPTGFVQEHVKDNYEVEVELEVRVTATKENFRTLTRREFINVKVKRAFLVPEIVRTEASKDWLREGEEAELHIVYEDRDANPKEPATWGQLQFKTVPDVKSLGGMLEYIRTDLVENNGRPQYDAVFKIDLGRAELTASIDLFAVEAVVVSRYAKPSPPQRINMEIATSLVAPATTWQEEVQATVGETLKYNFVIFDPKQEAAISLKSIGNLPASAQITCLNSARSVLQCTLNWTPTEEDVNAVEILAEVRSKNTNSRDKFESIKNLYLRARVLAKAKES